MNSFSNFETSHSSGLPRSQHFGGVLEAVKSHPSLRMLLDGEAGLARMNLVDQQIHKAQAMHWDYLRCYHPGEFGHQAMQHAVKNSERLLHQLASTDSLFKTTWHMLEHMLDILPDTAELLLKQAMYENPLQFLKLYGEMREWAMEVEHRRHRRGQVHAARTACSDRARSREAKRKAELAALVTKVKFGRAEEGDLLKYLELVMPDDPTDPDQEGGL